MDAKGYSAREERRLLDALGRGLLKEFPNPERSGCPGPDVLKKIASRTMPLDEAGKWLDHLGSCSPCYSDFSQFRKAYDVHRKHTLLAVAASILIVAAIAGWFLLQKHNEGLVAQTAVVDLRNRSVSRGSEPDATEPPLEIRRNVPRLDIFLPVGSSEGPYEVRIVTTSGDSVLSTSGAATLNDHITSVEVGVNLSSARPGRYILQIRKTGTEWNSYSLLLQ